MEKVILISTREISIFLKKWEKIISKENDLEKYPIIKGNKFDESFCEYLLSKEKITINENYLKNENLFYKDEYTTIVQLIDSLKKSILINDDF